VAVLPKP